MSRIQENKTYLVLPNQLKKIRELLINAKVSMEEIILEKRQNGSYIKLDGPDGFSGSISRPMNDPLIKYNSEMIEKATRVLANFVLVKYQPNFIDVGTVFKADMHYANGSEAEEILQFIDTTLGIPINDQYVARESEYGKYFDGKKVGDEIRYSAGKDREVSGIITEIIPEETAKTLYKF